MERGGSVYIMTNVHHTTLYVGVTSDLLTRVLQHREGHYGNSFTKKYNLTKLVYFENFSTIEEAIGREKQLKGGSRKKKEALITGQNPGWEDLFEVVREW